MRATFSLLAILLSVIPLASLPAQSEQAVPAGARVRITTADTSPVVVIGELIAVSESAVSVRRELDSGDVTIPRALVYRLEVSDGTNRGASARKGGLIGIVIGGLVGFALGEDCGPDAGICFPRSETAVAGAGVGAAAGALIGFMAGASERWRNTGVPARLSIFPTARSISIASTLRF